MATEDMTLKELEIKQAMEQAQAANAQAKAQADAAAAAAVAAQTLNAPATNVVNSQPAQQQDTTEETPGNVAGVAPASQPTELERADAELKAATEAWNNAQTDIAAEQAKINADRNRTFNDIVNDAYNEKMRQQQEMKQQEQANMMSSMATGTTELAAGIINLLSVGQLHASNQQYKPYSQDWMRKADQDIREHRRRRDNLNATMERLKMQQEQVRTAGRIEEMKLRQQQAADRLAIAQKNVKDAENRADKEIEREFRERQFERQAKQTDASIAQGWARINETKRQFNAELAAKGLNPKGEPDEALMKKIVETKAKISKNGKDENNRFFVDANGDVNVANLDNDEMKDLFSMAEGAIEQDLGQDEAKSFTRELEWAKTDAARNAVLKKWMAKSPKCGAALRLADPNYRGYHGEPQNDRQAEPENKSGYQSVDPNVGFDSNSYFGVK